MPPRRSVVPRCVLIVSGALALVACGATPRGVDPLPEPAEPADAGDVVDGRRAPSPRADAASQSEPDVAVPRDASEDAGVATTPDAAAPDARAVSRVDAAPVAPPSDGGALPTEEPPPGWVPAVVGVGYAGVRIRSTDMGQTWANEARLAATGGDDQNLLRSVAYGRGLWVTGGWQYFTSKDGITWTKQAHPCGGGIAEGLAYGAGRFIATCGDIAYVSMDGLRFTRGGRISVGGHPKVVYGGGKFAAFGDAGNVFSSTDGMTWTPLPGMKDAAVCDDTIKSRSACGVPANGARGQGVWLRGFYPEGGGGGIFRSTDGKTYARASRTNVEAFAFGFAPAN